MPAGHPTHYRPEYCQVAIDCGKEGKSIAQIGLACGVAKGTIYNWMRQHPEFLNAMKDAVSFAQAWYEDAGQKGLTADKFNSAIYNKIVSCRFRDDYSDASTVYTKTIESKTDEVPETQVDKIAREIAEQLKSEY